MPTLSKSGRTVQVAANDVSLLAYYRGDGWSVQGEEPAATPPVPALADTGESLDLGDQGDDDTVDEDDHPRPGPGDIDV